MLPKELAKLVPQSHLMTESEWRKIGVQQSRGWVSCCKRSKKPVRIHKFLLIIYAGALHDS